MGDIKKIFVLTDNKVVYRNIRKILDTKSCVSAYFYCSLENNVFRDEIERGEVAPLARRDNYRLLIDGGFSLGISAHSKQVFPSELVKAVLCINIHPGLNPYNRGWYPHVFSIINGLPTGVTIHVMDEKIDHGDIIVQEEVKICMHETSKDVYRKILKKEAELFKKSIDLILSGDFKRTQPVSEGNYNSIQDYKNLCKIDLNKVVTMGEAINYLRAMTHPPYTNAFFYDEEGRKVYVSIRLELDR